ncbi:MAG: glycosyltransferase family 39 protein [Bryobacteraceae bacterium]
MNARKDTEEGMLVLNPLTRLRSKLRFHAEALDRTPFLPLYCSAVLYVLFGILWSRRPLWYDELITYYIAKSPSWAHMFGALAKHDLNPPLQALLTGWSLRLFGDSDFAARIPSFLAFGLASYCVTRFVGSRLGRFYGLTAMLALWTTIFLDYSSEARPYALMVAFFGVAIVSWQSFIDGRKPIPALIGITLGISGVLMSHVFGCVLLLPLGGAEALRSWDRRRLDWKVWTAFLVPAPCLLIYIPMVRTYHNLASAYPPEFEASLLKAVTFFSEVLSHGGIYLFLALAGAICLSSNDDTEDHSTPLAFLRHEVALYVGLLSIPLLINLVLMMRGGAFWPRYAIGAGFGMSFAFAHLIAYATGGSRSAAAVAALILGAGIPLTRIVTPLMEPHKLNVTKRISWPELDSKLPIVDASGLTFLEMNKRESREFLSRVYYLTDRDSAVRFAHATIFEAFDTLGNWFPIDAHIAPYREFTAESRHFFVLCTLNYPEDWLIGKLMHDGATLKFLGEVRAGYRDSMVFDVRLGDPESAASPNK